jgi:hypothetical protein
MRAGYRNKLVTVWKAPTTTPDSDGFFEAQSPASIWVAIEPFSPSGEGRAVTHLVTGPYHAQITMDTRLVWDDNGTTRELFVRGFQNTATAGKELRMLCEEVIA